MLHAFSPRFRNSPVRIQSGVEVLDEILQGGLPEGSITEISGPECSGRTTLTIPYIAALTRQDKVCAWIDAADSLDPESVAANGVDLDRLLWVRCGESPNATQNELLEIPSSPYKPSLSQQQSSGGGSGHPRFESRGMESAVNTMLTTPADPGKREFRRRNQSLGTPGAQNRSLSSPPLQREEQVNSDRLPPRRGENLMIFPRRPISYGLSTASSTPITLATTQSNAATKTFWLGLDHALKTSDMLLHSGGFSCVLLDLAGIPAQNISRIPAATWFRFRAACERSRTSLVVITQHPCTHSCAELAVETHVGKIVADGKVMSGIDYSTSNIHVRSHMPATPTVRKSPQPSQSRVSNPGQWNSPSMWVNAK